MIDLVVVEVSHRGIQAIVGDRYETRRWTVSWQQSQFALIFGNLRGLQMIFLVI